MTHAYLELGVHMIAKLESQFDSVKDPGRVGSVFYEIFGSKTLTVGPILVKVQLTICTRSGLIGDLR